MPSKIEVFAQNVLGVSLTPAQIEFIDAIAQGSTTIVKHRKTCLAAANKVWRAYVKDGLQDLSQ